MPDSKAFDWICAELEGSTSLDRLEARGTVRLGLKEVGLEARTVSAAQLLVVIERVLPNELECRGIANSASVCEALARSLAEADLGGEGDSATPDEVFGRLGG